LSRLTTPRRPRSKPPTTVTKIRPKRPDDFNPTSTRQTQAKSPCSILVSKVRSARGSQAESIGSVADFWCHVVLYAPSYEIDIIEDHRHLHEQVAFTPELFDRWLQVFHDTVDGGWTGPLATAAKKRATGTTWAMAHRFLGAGVWVHPDLRS